MTDKHDEVGKRAKVELAPDAEVIVGVDLADGNPSTNGRDQSQFVGERKTTGSLKVGADGVRLALCKSHSIVRASDSIVRVGGTSLPRVVGDL
jgi:hypothetical protein